MVIIGRIKVSRLICALNLIMILHIAPPSIAGERFQPRGCEFSVEFPGEPTISDIIIPVIGKVQKAEYRGSSGGASDSYFFVAEGMPISKKDILTYHKDVDSYLLESAQAYAESNGLQFPEYKLFNDDLGKGIGMRGYKTVSGIRVIYSTMSLFGESSIIHLRVGCAAKLFPPTGMSKFMQSVMKN